MSEHHPDLQEGVDVESDIEVTEPPLFKVLLLNDDYTTMEFVVYVLMEHFNKSRTEATQIMLHVHTKGVGVCGVFTRDIADE